METIIQRLHELLIQESASVPTKSNNTNNTSSNNSNTDSDTGDTGDNHIPVGLLVECSHQSYSHSHSNGGTGTGSGAGLGASMQYTHPS